MACCRPVGPIPRLRRYAPEFTCGAAWSNFCRWQLSRALAFASAASEVDRWEGLHPSTQVFVKYQRSPTAFDGAQCAGPDCLIKSRASGSCDCARFKNAVCEGTCHCSLVLLAGIVPESALAAMRTQLNLSERGRRKVDQFFCFFSPVDQRALLGL
jgi:hypothetical protein